MISRRRAIAALMTFAGACAAPANAQGSPIALEHQSTASGEAAGELLASAPTAELTNWIIASRDNGELPFMVIDKVAATVFLFDPDGKPIGATPALFGMTAGDDSAPGVGDRELSQIKPKDRTTPAGRFVAKFGFARGHSKVLWVDYATSISLHAVVTGSKKDRRLQRLKSPTPDDNRITFGCINVPTAFYGKVVQPLFKDSAGVVYILPETRPLNEVFLAFRPTMPTGPAVASR